MAPAMIDAALEYVAHGISVCPVWDKNPGYANGNGYGDASNIPAVARMLFTSRRHTGLGLATGSVSGIWGLDVDGGEGLQSIRRLIAQHGRLPHGPVAETGHGWHIYFAWTCHIASRVGFLPGLDVRGEGAGLVAPPSLHPSGRRYQWRGGVSIFDLPPPPAPDWLLDLVKPPPVVWNTASPNTSSDRFVEGALARAESRIISAPNGKQSWTLNGEAYGIGKNVCGSKLSPDTAIERLVGFGRNMTNHDPRRPWTPKILHAIVKSGLEAGLAKSSVRRATNAA